MKKIFILALLFFILSGSHVFAADTIVVSDSTYRVRIAKSITFHVNVSAPAEITEIALVVRFPGTNAAGSRIFPKFTPASQVETDALWNLDRDLLNVPGGYLPPGAQGQYSWHIEDAAGNVLDTPPAPFRVDDDRFEWQKLENDRFALYWYEGGDTFGKRIFDRLNQTIDRIEEAIGAHIKDKIQVFVYADDLAFQSVLAPGHDSTEFVGATPVNEFNVILVRSAPENLQFAIVAAPHELVHMVIRQELGNGLGNASLPLWMNEGLASYYEYDPPNMEARYRTLLNQAIENDTLLRLRNYSSNRPSDYDENLLMYGQGYSVVEFILKDYGRDKMTQIFQEMKKGSTDESFQKVLGVDQDGLENLWRKKMNAREKDYSSQVVASPVAQPTFALSSGETAVPQAQPTATPASVSVANTPASGGATTAPSQSSPSSGGASTGLCGGILGGFALAMFGGYEWSKRRRSARL